MRSIEEAREEIERALYYTGGTHAFEDVRDAVSAGSLQFWPGPRSAVITEIIVAPRKKLLNFFLAGGDIHELEGMYPAIEAWGRAQGCTEAMFTGRPGWARSFLTKGQGWKRAKLEVFQKAL